MEEHQEGINKDIVKQLMSMASEEVPKLETAFDGNLSGLLDEVVELVDRFIYQIEEQVICESLWIAHTYIIGGLDLTPYAEISSPEPSCAKSLLMELMSSMSNRPWMTGGGSASSLLRKVEQDSPTMFLDESDNTFKKDKEYQATMTAMLNVGNERKGRISMSVPTKGQGWESQDFSPYCAKAFAGIGHTLPQTVLDRSIPLVLKKKKESDYKERFHRIIRQDYQPVFRKIQEKLTGWAMTTKCTRNDIQSAFPALFKELGDRDFDCWEPLLMIAMEAGGKWPELAVASARKLSGTRELKITMGVRCLIDIHNFYLANEDKTILPSQDIVNYLLHLETSPWAEYRGKGLTTTGLASILKRYEIYPDPSPHRDTPYSPQYRGYLVADFRDAWDRYLPKPPVNINGNKPKDTVLHSF